MKANIANITPGEGLGDLKFGMQRADVKALLGEPDEVESQSHDDDDEDITESWHYDEIEVSLSFDKVEDWKLCTIAVSNPEVKMHDKKVIGLSKDGLVEALKKMKITNLSYDDWSSAEMPDSMTITADDDEIVFWIEDGTVMDVQWGPLFIDEDTIKWPINGHLSKN